ncbi:MAG TPA: 2Fe-2S iron-sulfur cluster-binding protein [Polyangiaceae bacterium]
MSKVVFESTSGGAPKTVDAPEGGSLADLCDAVDAPIPFSCRSANCGTCRIEILEGEDELLPVKDEELDVLDIFQIAPPKHRLGCQSQMKPGLGVLRIRSINDDD